MISRMTKTAAAAGALALMTSTAYAGCNNSMYCNSGGHGHSAYESSASSNYSARGGVTLPGTHNYSSSYSMSNSAADAKYGTGSISGAFVDHSSVGSTYTSASVSNVTMPGLGANERLVSASCGEGINVHGANGAQVLGCYNVAQPVQPVQVQNYVRVVRPIVYVRYPVPVPVAVPTCGSIWSTTHSHHSSRRCGW